MAMTPVYKPENPCIVDLNGMFVGKWIYVCGRIRDDADRFMVNLMCGPGGDDDIALHINPRFPAQQIVRNTRSGGWGGEEKDGPGFPFKKGQLFGMTITCRKDGYEILANKYKLFTTYKHRIPFQQVTHVGVGQDCDIELISCGIEGVNIPAQVIENPSPGNFDIPFHNIRGRSIVIVGIPTDQNGRFDINFARNKGIDFHCNPRLNEQQIVRNTLVPDVGWRGPEERNLDFKFPFIEGVPFETKIRVERKRFVVEINGVHAFSFEKRLKALRNIRSLQIHGAVDIKKVEFY